MEDHLLTFSSVNRAHGSPKCTHGAGGVDIRMDTSAAYRP